MISLILTIYQMTLCNVKGVARSDEPTEDHHPTLQFPSAMCCSVFQFIVLVLRPATLVFASKW